MITIRSEIRKLVHITLFPYKSSDNHFMMYSIILNTRLNFSFHHFLRKLINSLTTSKIFVINEIFNSCSCVHRFCRANFNLKERFFGIYVIEREYSDIFTLTTTLTKIYQLLCEINLRLLFRYHIVKSFLFCIKNWISITEVRNRIFVCLFFTKLVYHKIEFLIVILTVALENYVSGWYFEVSVEFFIKFNYFRFCLLNMFCL